MRLTPTQQTIVENVRRVAGEPKFGATGWRWTLDGEPVTDAVIALVEKDILEIKMGSAAVGTPYRVRLTNKGRFLVNLAAKEQ